MRSRSAAWPGREHADVVAHAQIGLLVDEARVAAHAALGEHLVEHDGVHAAEHQIAVRMDIVFVGDRDDALVGLRGREHVVGERGAERRHAAAAKIGQRAEAIAIRVANGEDFAELVVGNRDGQARAARRTVLDAAQPDVEIAACGGRVEARETDLHESRHAAKPAGEQLRDLDVESHDTRRVIADPPRQTARRPRRRRPTAAPPATARTGPGWPRARRGRPRRVRPHESCACASNNRL